MDNRIKRDFKVKILDKYSKKFLWWEHYYFSIEFLDNVAPKYRDTKMKRACWIAFKIGDIVILSMWQAEDGLWYPF